MKQNKIYYSAIIIALVLFSSCSDFLDLNPLNKVPADKLLNDPNGIKMLMATLYNRLPIEDFRYNPAKGFNYLHDSGSSWVDHGWSTSFFTDDAIATHGSGVGPVCDYWDYSGIRQANELINQINAADIPELEKKQLLSEVHFIRAYMYFGLAKRYGGVPIIKEPLEYKPGSDNAHLFVPRSTEKETWDFILDECNLAVENLPEIRNSVEGVYRATKWSAYALMSRAALHAASIAKYWSKAPLTGEAVDKKLVGGMTVDNANNYYQRCIDASLQIINNSGKSLFRPTPANSSEAAKNYQQLFMHPESSEAQNEIIFRKNYIDGTATGLQGHCYDIHFNPSQTNPGYIAYGRFSVGLDLVDTYEDYSDDGNGRSAKIATRTDGNESYSVSDPTRLDVSLPFKKYNNPIEPFIGKDARMSASILFPGSVWKGVNIVIQAGLIKPDGSLLIYTDNEAQGKDGNIYYTYGAPTRSGYSGFFGLGSFDNANFTCTGFSLKKFLLEDKTVAGVRWSSTTPYIDFRLPEIYLNYAEAVVESGKGDINLAKTYLNAIRRRAGHRDQVQPTLANILKERRIEFAFEGLRYWDLIRRRDFHLLFPAGTRRTALLPILDLREANPKYIFVRANNYYDEKAGGVFFQTKSYYLDIPGISTNKLIQNPQY